MTIATVLEARTEPVITVEAGQTVTAAIALLAGRRIGAVPVTADGKVIGIFSERDVIYGLATHGPALLDAPIESVMTAPAITVSPDLGILMALALMTKRRIRHLPVVQGDTLTGIVSIGDLVKHRMDRIEAEADAMRSYIQGA
jgi:CBS domain-containing protein